MLEDKIGEIDAIHGVKMFDFIYIFTIILMYSYIHAA